MEMKNLTPKGQKAMEDLQRCIDLESKNPVWTKEAYEEWYKLVRGE